MAAALSIWPAISTWQAISTWPLTRQDLVLERDVHHISSSSNQRNKVQITSRYHVHMLLNSTVKTKVDLLEYCRQIVARILLYIVLLCSVYSLAVLLLHFD